MSRILLTASLLFVLAGCDTTTLVPSDDPVDPAEEPIEENWSVADMAPMPTPRLGLASCAVNEKIYAIGGFAAITVPSYMKTEEYDVATDTWSTKADMPTGRGWLACAVVGEKIYVIGGSSIINGAGLATVEEYDPALDTWTTKASMPTARRYAAISEVGGRIYVIGGQNRQREAISTVEVYNPATDTWSTGTHMPVVAFRPFAGTVAGKIYVYRAQMTTEPFYFTAVFEYDPGTDTWTEKACGGDRWHLTTSVAHGKIYAIGGLEWSGCSGWGCLPSSRLSRVVDSYNPATNEWNPTLESDSVKVWGAAASSVNERIYIVGGLRPLVSPTFVRQGS